MKNVIFFCNGDSSKISTWSNVPYLFTKTLQNRGISIKRVNTAPNRYIEKIYNRSIGFILNRIFDKPQLPYFRTKFHKLTTNYIIKKSVKRHPEADMCIFIGYGYYNKYNNIPSLLFGDWTYKTLIKDRLNRELYSFERPVEKQENEALSNSKFSISLFPVCTEQIKKDYPSANIKYLNRNVINLLYDKHIDQSIIEKKTECKKIIFIGNEKYTEGVKLLVEAVKNLNKKGLKIELHIIGINNKDLNGSDKNIFYYGYLDKNNEIQRHTYYKLLIEASLFVNPTPVWGGYSSCIEAMYFYTPIIVSPYEDFVRNFGENINFGMYNNHFTVNCLSDNIKKILYSENYTEICKEAHNTVKDYTWEKYVESLLKIILQTTQTPIS